MKNHKLAMRHVLLFVYILLSGKRCVFSSLLAGIKRQNMEQNPLMATLQIDLLRQLLNQETIIRLSMSKTISVMKGDILTMQKTMVAVKEENRQFKTQASENEKQMTNVSFTLKQQFQTELGTVKEENRLLKEKLSKYKNQIINVNIALKQQFQTELKAVKEENRLLKEQLSEYVKQITHINTTLKQQFQTEVGTLKKEIQLFKKQFSEYEKQSAEFNLTLEQMRKTQDNLLAESKTHNGEIEDLSIEDKLLKNKSSEYEKQFSNINVTLGQIQREHFFHITETTTTTRDIKDLCMKNEIILKKQGMEYEKNIADMNVTLLEMQQNQVILKSEKNSQKRKIKDISEENRLYKEKMSTIEKVLADINIKINKVTKKLFPRSAFHAVLTSDRGTGVIVFNQVLTNIGNAYDNTTGIFTAHSNGTYIFSWSIETYGVRTDTVLEVNGMVNGSVTADESSSYYDTSTSFAVLELQAGDTVNIRVKRGTAKSTRTMFSGWQYSSSDQISAFYASLTRRNSGPSFLFDKVRTNQDSVYTPHDGYFTAPRDGLYVFTSSVSIYGSNQYNYYIYTKGLKGPDMWVDSTSGQYDNTGSMHVAYMSAGEKAFVGAGSSYEAESGSMFAGWMVAPGSSFNYPAFIASLPSSSSSSPIHFKKTLISPHTGFDSSTGIFTATVHGVYVFLWNIEAEDQVTTTSLRVNGVDRGQTRSDGRNTKWDDSAAVSVVKLEVGDRVSVIILSGTADETQTIFCGWLLYEL